MSRQRRNVTVSMFHDDIYDALYSLSKSPLKKNLKKCKKYYLEEATSPLAGFHAGPLDWLNLGIWNFGFCGGRKTGEPGVRTTLVAGTRTNNKLNPHEASGWN